MKCLTEKLMWVWQHCLIDSVERKRILLQPSATVTGTSSLCNSICSLWSTSVSPKYNSGEAVRLVDLEGSRSVNFLSGLIMNMKLLFGLSLFLLEEKLFSDWAWGGASVTDHCQATQVFVYPTWEMEGVLMPHCQGCLCIWWQNWDFWLCTN